MTSTTPTAKSGGNYRQKDRKVVSDKVDNLTDKVALLTKVIMDSQTPEKSFFIKSSLYPPTHFKSVPTHVEKSSTQVSLNDTLDEQALRIAELEAKNELLEEKFNTLTSQITVFMGLCNKHTQEIKEVSELAKNSSTIIMQMMEKDMNSK